jgi:hypothetical protein
MVRARRSLGAGRTPTGNDPQFNEISNRQWKGLEIAVTPTKHLPKLFLIDKKNGTFKLEIVARTGPPSPPVALNRSVVVIASEAVEHLKGAMWKS